MTKGASPAVAQVLALNERLEEAVRSGDVKLLEALLSRDLVVSDPTNAIRRRDDLLALFGRGQVAYRSVESTIDFANELQGLVVIMGTESTTLDAAPPGSPWGAGTTLRRRFTNVFRNEEGSWRLLIKQSTVFAVEQSS